jgi:hypothetical protein
MIFLSGFRKCHARAKEFYIFVSSNQKLMRIKSEENRLSGIVFIIAFLNILLHFAFYNTLGFHRDGLLYFSLGQHLAAGYASVPPFTGFVSWIMIHILGYTLLSARLIPMLMSGVYVLLGASITKELGGKKYAQILTVITLVVTPINLRAFLLFQPVGFDVMFWGLIIWVILKWINTDEDKYLLLLGLVAGMGMLNKYLIALEIFSFLIAFAFSSRRNVFTKRAFYFCLLIGFVVFLPNLIWQIKHHLPTIEHMQALHDTQLVHVNRFTFFTDQFFMSSVAVLLVIPGIISLFSDKRLRSYRPLVTGSVIVLLILAILRGKSYYTIGLFVFWIAAGGVWWEKQLKKQWSRILLTLIILLLTLPMVPMGIPVFGPKKLVKYFAVAKDKFGLDAALRWEDGRIHDLPQDYADMLGWDELAAITAKAYDQVQDKQSVMIYAENYGEAGAVEVLGKRYHLPDPVCFNGSFFYWFPRHPKHQITSFIYINSTLGKDVRGLFGECKEIGKISNPLAREYGTGVWLCTQPRVDFNKFWEQRVSQIKNPFSH